MSNAVVDIFMLSSEAGTHFTGQADAPEFILQRGGLETQLKTAGFRSRIHQSSRLHTGGDLHEPSRWAPMPKVGGVRNLENTLKVLRHVKEWLTAEMDTRSDFAIFLGGDCTLTMPTFAAFKQAYRDRKVGLMYVDGDADLTLPEDGREDGTSGILDSTVISHLTARPGSVPSMIQVSGEHGPLVTSDNIVLFGFDPLQPRTEHWVYLVESGLKCFTRPTVMKNSHKSAEEALLWLEERCDIILLHFDVDVIDAGTFPLANFPHYAGLPVQDALAVLKVFLRSDKVKGMILTEINPGRDKDGSMISTLTEALVEGLAGRSEATLA